MNPEEKTVLLNLTVEEARDLFGRCLKSADEDNQASRAVLLKLAQALDKADDLRAA